MKFSNSQKVFLIKNVLLTISNYIIEKGACNFLNRRHFRIVMMNVPPYNLVTMYPNGSSDFVGTGKLNVEWLATKLNFSFDFVYPTQEQVKLRGNEASIDMIASGADFGGNALAVTPERCGRSELATYPNWDEGYRMIVPRPGEQHRLFAFIQPFDAKVWLLLGISVVAMSLIMGLLSSVNARYTKSGKSSRETSMSNHLAKYSLYNVNILTNHGDYLNETQSSFLIAAGCWLLGASILVYGYCSLVVSAITLPIKLPSVNTFEDVLAHPDISLILRTDTYLGNAINMSNDISLYKALREKALKRPESVGNEGVINITQLLLTGKYAYAFIETAVRLIVNTQYVKEGKCRFKLSNRLPLSNSYFFLWFQKGSKDLARGISLGMMQNKEAGLITQYAKMLPWLPKSDECFANDAKRTAKQTTIKLVDLTSAFFILGVGLALSLLAFVVELAISNIYFQTKQ